MGPDLDLIAQAAAIATLLAGCTCNPEITIEEARGFHHAHVAHDDGCALLQHRAAPWN